MVRLSQLLVPGEERVIRGALVSYIQLLFVTEYVFPARSVAFKVTVYVLVDDPSNVLPSKICKCVPLVPADRVVVVDIVPIKVIVRLATSSDRLYSTSICSLSEALDAGLIRVMVGRVLSYRQFWQTLDVPAFPAMSVAIMVTV